MRKKMTPPPDGGRQLVNAPLPFDYLARPPQGGAPARELVLLLHGFGESGSHILRKLEGALPADALVVAPNGPFPSAERTEQGYKLRYTWYFYNPLSGEYFIDMTTALAFLESGIQALGAAQLPKRIIGFSQGGYLAPFAAQRLGHVHQVIGLACEYLWEELEAKSLPFRVDGVHGELDEVVKVSEARATHALLKEKRGVAGELVVLPRTAHRIDDEMRGAVGKLVGQTGASASV